MRSGPPSTSTSSSTSQKGDHRRRPAAYDAYHAYVEDIHKTGQEYIDFARKNGYPIMVVAGRPYHMDPEINHGINDLITGFRLC